MNHERLGPSCKHTFLRIAGGQETVLFLSWCRWLSGCVPSCARSRTVSRSISSGCHAIKHFFLSQSLLHVRIRNVKNVTSEVDPERARLSHTYSLFRLDALPDLRLLSPASQALLGQVMVHFFLLPTFEPHPGVSCAVCKETSAP